MMLRDMDTYLSTLIEILGEVKMKNAKMIGF